MLITDKDFQRVAVIVAAGHQVEVVKLPCSPRCAATYKDTPETRALSQAYDECRVIEIPAKTILHNYGLLMMRAKELKRGVL